MRPSTETIDASIKLRIIRNTSIITHRLLICFLWTIVLMSGVLVHRLLCCTRAVRQPVLQASTRQHALLFCCAVLVLLVGTSWPYSCNGSSFLLR